MLKWEAAACVSTLSPGQEPPEGELRLSFQPGAYLMEHFIKEVSRLNLSGLHSPAGTVKTVRPALRSRQ